MRKLTFLLSAVLLTFLLSSFGIVENAFKAGVISTIIISGIIGIIFWISRLVVKHIINHPVFEVLDEQR